MAAPVPVGALQAIEAMPANSEAQDYAYDLYRAFPGKIADLYRAVFHNPWDVQSRAQDEERFAEQVLEMKANNCIVCHRNGLGDCLPERRILVVPLGLSAGERLEPLLEEPQLLGDAATHFVLVYGEAHERLQFAKRGW